MDLGQKKVLVIGGAGFIGSHIVDQLLAEPVREIVVFDNFVRGTRDNLADALRDDRVRVVEGSITDRDALAAVMRDMDGVFHLAALWLFECVHEPRSALEVNVDGTYNVIAAAQDAGVQRIVFSSSASVYGDALASPMTEDHPFNNRTTYGATKIAGEQFLRAFHEQHGLSYVGLRYMNVYGPRMDYRGVYASVIMKVLDRIMAGDPPVIFGDGSQAYDFIHVFDVARANILAMKSSVEDEFINVGTGVRTTINDLVHLLLAAANSAIEPEYRPLEQSFVTERVGSTQKAEQVLGFQSAVALQEGIRSVVEWRLRTQAS